MGGCFSPVEMQQTAAERKIHWVWSVGNPAPGLEEMTDANKVLPSLQRVLSGGHLKQYYPPWLAKWLSDLFGTGGHSDVLHTISCRLEVFKNGGKLS